MSVTNNTYNRKRFKWICALSALAVLITLALLWAMQGFGAIKNAELIPCSERGSVDYAVNLKENDFFDDETLDGGEAYVGELIESVGVDFKYSLKIRDEINCEYFYRADAVI